MVKIDKISEAFHDYHRALREVYLSEMPFGDALRREWENTNEQKRQSAKATLRLALGEEISKLIDWENHV